MVVVKAAEYYIANKKILKENAKNNYRNLPEIKKEAKREYGKEEKRVQRVIIIIFFV